MTAAANNASTRSVIIAGARTPMGRLLGSLKDFSAAQLGGVAIEAALRARRGGAGAGRVRDHGPRPPGRHRPDHRPAGGGRGRDPDEHPRADGQQGLPLRAGRDRARRPAHPGRRVRDRRRRRHGVDDAGTAPAAGLPRGLQVRRRHAGRLDGVRRAVLRVRPSGHGAGDGHVQRAVPADPRGAGRLLRTLAPAGGRGRQERHLRRRDRAGADPAAQGRPRGGQCRRGHPRRHDDGDRWAGCARRSGRTARSPRARPRRSPTAPPRSWS